MCLAFSTIRHFQIEENWNHLNKKERPSMSTVSLEMDIDHQSFIRSQTVIVLKYDWLKEEIGKETAQTIAEGLYAAPMRNGLVSEVHFEKLSECNKRLEKADILLKWILKGNFEIYTFFLHLLKTTGNEYIARELEECQPSEDKLKKFHTLQGYPLDRAKQFQLDRRTVHRLRFYLNEETTIHAICDCFLSNFYFSIRDHTNILTSPMNNEQRVNSVLETMERCHQSIIDVLSRILTRLRLEHVFEICFAVPFENDEEMEVEQEQFTDLPLRRLGMPFQERLVEVTKECPNLLKTALTEVSFEYEGMEIGSLIIRLRPVSEMSWKKLQDQCHSGEIKKIISYVYQNEQMTDMLEEGLYSIYVEIYKEPLLENTTGEILECQAVLHLKDNLETNTMVQAIKFPTEVEKKRRRNFFDTNMRLLSEEMEVSQKLLSFLQDRRLIDDEDEGIIMKEKLRTKKVQLLLSKLSTRGRQAAFALIEYIKETDLGLMVELKLESDDMLKYEFVTTVRPTMPTSIFWELLSVSACESLSTFSTSSELLFSALVELCIRKKIVIEEGKKTKGLFVDGWDFKIARFSSKCYFNTDDSVTDQSFKTLDKLETKQSIDDKKEFITKSGEDTHPYLFEKPKAETDRLKEEADKLDSKEELKRKLKRKSIHFGAEVLGGVVAGGAIGAVAGPVGLAVGAGIGAGVATVAGVVKELFPKLNL